MADYARTQEAVPELDILLRDLRALEELTADWDESSRHTVSAIKQAIDALNKAALTRLIRALKSDPAASAALRRAASDELVYAVLRHHELIRPSLQERVERALASVRPMLESHGGDVELVSVKPPKTVEIRLVGACDGCPASSITLASGVEQAIREQCPEITEIRQAKGMGGNGSSTAHFVSPFARAEDKGWTHACRLEAVPENDLLVAEVGKISLLLSRIGDKIVCFENACAHLAMPLDQGELADGVLTCPHHGFRYLIESGECLTAPEVQLHTYAVRVTGGSVMVKIS